MRADRLLSMLMLLQARGRMTAADLARELEVSERTIYRDVTALSFSGVPVYAERGPGGGISLIERYRSDLTGLNKDEVRALFMLNIPPALADLGLDQELRAALRKLSAALPATLRGDEVRARQRIHLDSMPWKPERSSPSAPHLQLVQQAVWESRVLEVGHRPFYRPDVEPVFSVIRPYGLVAKAGDWHVVAQREDHMIVLQVNRLEDVRLTGEIFQPPGDFDLETFWVNWCRLYGENRPSYPVLLRVSAAIAKNRHACFGEGVNLAGGPDSDGWSLVEVEFEYLDQARAKLLSLGGAIEVLEPVALRYSMMDYARQIVDVYTSGCETSGFMV